MAKKYEVKCERYITDFRGREVCPGNIVAVSRSGRGKRALEMHMVSSITKSNITYCGAIDDYDYKQVSGSWKRVEKGTTRLRFNLSRSELFRGETQPHLVVIDDPLFAINNPNMKNMLRTADYMKDEGFFPSDYKLGEAVIEHEDSNE
jgi:hypothetical protein